MMELDEAWRECEPLGPADIELLRYHNFDPIAKPLATWSLLRTNRIVTNNRLFTLNPEGRRAFVTPVRGGVFEEIDPETLVHYGEIVDLLAWHPAAPGRWALWRDAASFLGTVGPQLIGAEPVPVHRDPLGWFRAGCRGLVLLSDRPRMLQAMLQRLVTIQAADGAHAAELRRIAETPWPTPAIITGRAA